MFDWFRRLFESSIYEDEETTRIAHTLNNLGWITIIVVIFLLASKLIIGGGKITDSSAYILVLIILILLGMQLLLRKRQVRSAGTFLVVAIWVVITYQAWVADGLRDVSVLVYPILVLVASLLFGWREGLIVGLISLAMIWFFAFQEHSGVRFDSTDEPFYYARDLTAVFILSSVLTYYITQRLNRSLSNARLELRERLRADEKLQVQAQYLSALHDTTFGLLNRLELKPLLESILVRAGELLETPHVGIDLLTPDERYLRQELGNGIFKDWNGTLTTKGVGLTGKVWESGETMLIEDYGSWGGRNPDADGIGFCCVAGTPLKSGNTVLGALIVASTEKKRNIPQEKVDLLERLGALASLAIVNARLYEEAQKELRERKAIEEDLRLSEERLQRQTRYLTAIHETTFGLLNRLELNPLLESILLRAGELLDTPHVGIDLVLPDGSGLRQELGTGEFIKWNKTTIQLGQGMVGKIWQTGETMLVDDYEAYEDKLAVVSRSGFVRVIGTPMKSGQTVIGTLVVAYRERNRVITPEEVAVLERLAALASLAIDNARLYEDAQRELNERKSIEQDLRSSEERFRKVFNNGNIAISIVTLEDGIFLDANEAFWRLTGLTSAQALGHSVLEFDMWANPEARKQFVNELLTKGSLENVEVVFPGRGEQDKSSLAYYELIDIKGQRCILSMFYDVSEQRQAQRELRESEERFRKVFHTSPVAICITTVEDGRFLDANDAYWKLSGYEPQILENTSLNVGVWTNEETRLEFTKELKEKRRVLNPNYVVVNRKTHESHYVVAMSELIELRGEPCVLTMLYDITEQKQAEHALTSAEARTRAIIASIPDMIFEISNEGKFLDFMASADLVPIMKPDEFIGRDINDLLPPKIAEQTMFALERALVTGQVHAFEYGLPPGEEIQFFEARVAPVTSESAIMMVRDISQRKWVETEREKLINELENKNAESETLRESMAIIVETLDESKAVSLILEQLEKVVPCNSASVQLLKGDVLEIVSTLRLYPVEEHIGRQYKVTEGEPSRQLLSGNVAYVLVEDVRELAPLFSGPPYGEIRAWLAVPLRIKGKIIGIITLDGHQPRQFTQKHAELAATYANQVAIALENARLFSEVQRELVERKKLIEELESKNAELERFTYTVSHDLKSPVITIRGFLGFLEQDALSGNMQRLRGDIKRISDATDKMQTLLNELLDLSRIGRLVNPPASVSFNDIVADALSLVQGQIQNSQVQVIVQPNMPSVYVDRPRMVEALQNLIDNAAKFTREDPQIEIGQNGTENDMPIFFIRDNGIGIDPIHHERIFGLFNKLDVDSDGTGIGLALVKRIIEVHKGRIWVQSEPQGGSTFFFTLPTPGAARTGPES